MTARQKRYDLGPLTDFMAEDILSTPGRKLVEEVTEDWGDPEALASAFDKIVYAELPDRADKPARSSIGLGQHRTGQASLSSEPLLSSWRRTLSVLGATVFPNRLAMAVITTTCVALVAAIVAIPLRNQLELMWKTPSGSADGISTTMREKPEPPRLAEAQREQEERKRLAKAQQQEEQNRQKEQTGVAALQQEEEPKRQGAARLEAARQEEQRRLAEAPGAQPVAEAEERLRAEQITRLEAARQEEQKRQEAARLVAARQEEQKRQEEQRRGRDVALRLQQEEQKRQSAARDTAAVGLPGETSLVRAKPPADPAIAELDRAISANPNDIAAIDRRGRLLAFHGNYGSAIKDFDDVIRLRPRDAEALNNRCWARAIIGDLQSALNDCNAALQLRPGYADAFDSRALVNLKSGQPGDAIADYDAALRIDPKRANSLYGRGLAKIKTDDVAGGNLDIAEAKSIQANIAEEFSPTATTPSGTVSEPQVAKTNHPEQVRQAQAELTRLGCFNGRPDGQLNDATRNAVRALWRHTGKPIVEINITDDFVDELKRLRTEICPPERRPAATVANRPPSRSKETPAAPARSKDAAAAPPAPAAQPSSAKSAVGF